MVLLNKAYFLILLTWPGVVLGTDPINVLKHMDSRKLTENLEERNRTSTVFLDNMQSVFPAVMNRNPLIDLIKGVSEQYTTIILDCFPLVQNFPPKVFDNIYFQVPRATAELNKSYRKGKTPVTTLWIYPHLHIPFLNLDPKDKVHLKYQPIEIARYMARESNSIYPGTVPGVLVTATPLIIDSYRSKLKDFKHNLVADNLRFGLLIESWSICSRLPHKIKELEKVLEIFDLIYFHQPRVMIPEESTGSALDDAVLEARAYDGLFLACEEAMTEYLPEGKTIQPVRGYLRAKFEDSKQGEPMRTKFKFDVVRF